MKKLLKLLLKKFGYEVSRYKKVDLEDPHAALGLKYKGKITDLEALAQACLGIPGMITPKSGQFLYTLCYTQLLQGDVVEIGSWQGRSTSFLARAVKNSGNGRFFAIDHFRGNCGKEHYYVIKNKNLSDLKESFKKNMERLKLLDKIVLLDMPNSDAVDVMSDVAIRFLFVDGDHTKSGVQKDIELFFPKLVDGAVIVFDDFSKNFPGLIEAIDELLKKQEFSRIMTYEKTLVLVK